MVWRLLPLQLLALFLLLASSHAVSAEEATVGANGRVNTQQQTTTPEQHIQQIMSQIMQLESPQEQLELWHEILQVDPHHCQAHFQLGMATFSSGSSIMRDDGMDHMEQAMDATHCQQKMGAPVPMPTLGGMRLAMMLGRYRWEMKDFLKGFYYLEWARRAALSPAVEPKQDTAQLCVEASLATMLHPFPNTTQQADQMYDFYIKSAREFLQQHLNTEKQNWVEEKLAPIPGAAEDPYVHCILTLFHLSFYYRADVAEAARLHYQVATTLWPELKYTSPRVTKPTIPPHLNLNKPCVTRKIKLGIASGFLSPGSPVSADFGGVLQRLDRDMFDITYLHFQNSSETIIDPFAHRHKDTDKILEFYRDRERDLLRGAWPTRFYAEIEALELDMIVYLDLTMSPFANRMAMARLAPVQANSHGHPVTSGIENVDYFISWGAAELPYSKSKEHYSEELILLDSDVPHQYYEPRHDSKSISMINGQYFGDKMTRAFFRMYMLGAGTLEGGNKWNSNTGFKKGMFEDRGNKVRWYTCMQKPHKFMPEMDPLLCGVVREDPDGVLVLHQPDTVKLLRTYEDRLEKAGCDMDRVYFVPQLPHHVLLALYKVSTLILDSYPAGGCTTTREALELNKIVVTLPARLLGGRWSYAYYQMINDETLNEHVIATSPRDYIEKACTLGKDVSLRTEMERRIAASLQQHLYRNWDAVKSWEKALLKISPVEKREQCEAADS